MRTANAELFDFIVVGAGSSGATLAARLSEMLSQWTGRRWIASVSSAPGKPTLSEQKTAKGDALRNQAENNPLVQAILKTFPGARLDAVEIDRHLLAPLREVVEPHGVKVHHGDALAFDFASILGGEPATVVANLPYNVATPLVVHLLETQPLLTRMLVMVQREVGERFAAKPGDEAFGAVSLRIAYFAEAQVVGTVPPTVFTPKPKVDSALVSITRLSAPLIDPARVSEEELFAPVRLAFAQRRKMLRRSLADWATDGVFERAGVDETRRPEELTLEEFARLAESR